MSTLSIPIDLDYGRVQRVRRQWVRAALPRLGRLAGLAFAIWMVTVGLSLRRSLWDLAAPIRFRGDIQNGMDQGRGVLHLARLESGLHARELTWPAFLQAVRDRYDVVESEGHDERFSLDYTPARLLVMSTWMWHTVVTFNNVQGYDDKYAAPLLRFNIGCTLASALFMFLIVRHWVNRQRSALGKSKSDIGWIIGLIAALGVWFNPCVLVDANMWPQWDVWLVPWFLAAVWLASIEWWLTAGVCIAVTAMFKGQVLMAAPVLLLWPLFGGRLGAAMRFVIGFFFGVAIVTLPWLCPSWAGLLWIGLLELAAFVAILIVRYQPTYSRAAWPWWSIFLIAIVAAKPFIGATFDHAALALTFAAVVTPLVAHRYRWKRWTWQLTRSGCGAWIALLVAAAVFRGAAAFGGTWSWYTVSFVFPTYHFPMMAGGDGNLPQILQERFGWNHVYETVMTLPAMKLPLLGPIAPYAVTMKVMLITIYAVTLVLFGIGAAMQSRRGSARVLAALAGPWIVMFTVLPQMHERYLMWGAACGVMLFAISPGAALLQIIIILLATVNIFLHMWNLDANLPAALLRGLRPLIPSTAWMLMLSAAIVLYISLARDRTPAGAGPRSAARRG